MPPLNSATKAANQLRVLLALGFVLSPVLAHSTTYYVATTGSDSNTCTQAQNPSTPKRTINAALNCLGTAAYAGAGHTVQVAAGTYVETINNNLPGGSSWSAPFTLEAATIGTVTLQPPVGAGRCMTIAAAGSQYAIISGLVCDGSNVSYDGIKITDSSYGAASFIRLQDVEIKYAKHHGILVTRSTDNEFIRLTVHDNGTTDNSDHGIYIGEAAHRTLIADSTVYNNHAAGLMVYSTITPPDGCIVRNTRSYTNGTSGLVLSATNTLAYNNVIYNNHTTAGNFLGSTESGLKVGGLSTGVKLYNNTVYGQTANTGDAGIEISSGAVNTKVKNNIAYNNAKALSNSGTNTILANNLTTTDPKFVAAANADFHLQATSPAINTGATLRTVPTDYDGMTRPQGAAYDIGAYEFVSAPVAFDFSLTNGGDQSVTQEALASNTITATLAAGTAQAVSFFVSGLPLGTLASFAPATCTPTCTTTLTISTSASTPAGAYTITVTGKAGQLRRTTDFQLTVNPAPFDFSLDKPADITVTQGGSDSTTPIARYVSGTSQSISFTVSGLPQNTTPSFSPANSCIPTLTSPCSITLAISTSASTPTDTYTIIVTGTGGGVTRMTSFTLTVSSGSPTSFCLQGTGPLLTLSGVRTAAYGNTSLADNTRIDASTAQFLTSVWDPVRLGGGSNLCFSGGEVLRQLPPSTSWKTMHDETGAYITDSSLLHVENTRVFDSGDGVSINLGGMNWTIRGVYFKYIRDDCVEDDFLYSGTIDDSLFDGCYDGISARAWSGQSPDPGDGSTNLIVMKNSLLRLQEMDAAYSAGPLPNHNAFWKWDPKAPQVALYNNVFRADADSWEGNGAGMYMAPPPGKLADCENNIMVWLGAGPFPEPLPTTFNGKPCFTITTDQSVWDTAVAQWKANHPTTLSDVAAPIVSLFSPGIVGSPTLTGIVTLTATAVDDREVAGVQFKLNGQNLGAEVITEASLTKFTLTWDSHTQPNGTYTLTATARDASGNTQTSTGVTVAVSN